MNFQASRKKRHAAALRLPGTVAPPRTGGRRNPAVFLRFTTVFQTISLFYGDFPGNLRAVAFQLIAEFQRMFPFVGGQFDHDEVIKQFMLVKTFHSDAMMPFTQYPPHRNFQELNRYFICRSDGRSKEAVQNGKTYLRRWSEKSCRLWRFRGLSRRLPDRTGHGGMAGQRGQDGAFRKIRSILK